MNILLELIILLLMIVFSDIILLAFMIIVFIKFRLIEKAYKELENIVYLARRISK